MEKRLFAFWTGSNPLPQVRADSLRSMEASGLSATLITLENLFSYLPEKDLHPSFWSLNLAHRSDYLRAFFMHTYGGGYSDIKPTTSTWISIFDKVKRSPALFGAGYREIHRHGVANVHQSAQLLEYSRKNLILQWVRWRWLQVNYRQIIGNCAFIFKPGTQITTLWWDEVNRRMDSMAPLLRRFPATEPKERMKTVYDGKVSNYPVPWSFLLGDVLQPLAFRFSRHLLKTLPTPRFENYQ